MTHHTHDPVCPSCEEKLDQAHPELASWFRAKKAQRPSLHVAWSFRDKESQEEAFAEGRTKLHFPASKHNVTPSLAIDLFELTDSGVAKWNPITFAELNQENEKAGLSILWGGKWKTLGDDDHFQLHVETAPKA